MNKLLIVATAALLLIGCLAERRGASPSHDLEFRFVDETGFCFACVEAIYRPTSEDEVPVQLGEAFASASDVVSIEALSGHDYVMNFKFTDEAASRLEDLTTKNIGRVVAIVSKGQVVSLSRLSGPFSSSMQLSAPSEVEVVTVYGLVTQPDPARAPSPQP